MQVEMVVDCVVLNLMWDMGISDVTGLVATLSTIISGFAIMIRFVYKASSKLLEAMAKNHADLLKPIVDDIRQSAVITARISDLEQEHKDMVAEQSHISAKLDAMSNRIDETYSLLLKLMKN